MPTKTKFKSEKNSNIFDFVSGNSKITKNHIDKNKGDFVTYSANTKENGVFGYINTFDHNTECLQITTNGVYAGTVFTEKKDESLSYDYLTIELRKVFADYNFNWGNKPIINKDIELNIPIDTNDNFDLITQTEIAEKIKKTNQIKKSISEEFTKINFNFD